MTVAAAVVQGILLTFALVVILMPPFVLILRRLGFGKRIRIEGPGSHLVKEGTPTMGGLLIIIVVGAAALLFHFVSGRFFDPSTIAPILTLGLVGALGVADDYLNARTGDGIRIRQKLLWQVVVAGVIAYQIQQTYAIAGLRVPFVGEVPVEPLVYVLFAAFAIVATTNGVNFTDGLDGLAGGTLIFAFVAYMIIALLNVPAQPNLAILCALLIGALLGFLWFNVHPAQIIMGDSGALSLGATLAVVATVNGQLPLLAIVGIVFFAVIMSVVLQVLSFRLRGRRIFRMTPLHHHFELIGWAEEKITVRFWIVAALAALLGFSIFLSSVQGL